MPQLTDNELDEIMSEYAMTGKRFYEDLDAQIFEGKSFDELPHEEQAKFNLIAETCEEVYAESVKSAAAGGDQNR